MLWLVKAWALRFAEMRVGWFVEFGVFDFNL